MGVLGKDGEIVGSEDCLILNIWVFEDCLFCIRVLFLVMVWIYGGSNMIGFFSIYFGYGLVGLKDVVVVIINYCFGLMGWFVYLVFLVIFENFEDVLGNFGILDIIVVLKWVN